MKPSKALLSTLFVSVAVASVGTLARKGAEKGWQNIFDETPPPKDEENALDMKDAVLWACITGFSTAVLRLGTRRYLRSKQSAKHKKVA